MMKTFNLNFKIILICTILSPFLTGNVLAKYPNVLLITADDMNWDSVGVYGCPVENTTPNIDHLSSEGVMFDYGYVQISLCTPSRQVMLSGSHTPSNADSDSKTPLTNCGVTLSRSFCQANPDKIKQDGRI
jgi:hypothetical protein